MSFGSFRRVKAGKKAFECVWCHTECSVGQPRVHYFGTWEGELQNWHMHPECHDAFQREDDGDGQIHDEKHTRGMTCGEMLDAGKGASTAAHTKS